MKITAVAADNGMFDVQEVIMREGEIMPDFKPLPMGIRFQASTETLAKELAQVAAEQLDALGYDVRVL
jgi:hypothetical protein